MAGNRCKLFLVVVVLTALLSACASHNMAVRARGEVGVGLGVSGNL